ncbi:MAG: hypothetical protein ACRCX2_37910 [Paraclostridium sp.]
MAEKSSFFNSELVGDRYDREYKAEDYANYFGSFIGNGVFPNPSTGLQVIATNSMNVTVKAGKAWINGYMYYNDSDIVLKIDPADGVLKRIDRIVVRLDLINRVASCKVLKGTFASSPVDPALTRNNDIYELCIANISVNNGVISIIQSNITDTKLDDNVCGIVTQTIKEIDTTTLFNKLQGFIEERGKDVDYWLNQATSQWEIDFNTWFDTIKDILDGDVAGNLSNRIKALEDKVGGGLLAENVSIKDTNNYFTATNVEGALNELFLNADNGKKTIATSVGSPLVNSDTFSAMGTKIDTLTNTFKTNLTAKGVTVGTTDKMSILIDKVNKLKVIKTPVVAGDNFLIYTSDVSSEYNYSAYTNIFTHKVAFSDGSYRVKCSFNTTSNSWVTYIKIIHSRNGNIIFSQEFSRNITTPLIATLDIQNVVIGDNIEIECKKSSSSSEGKVKINSISVGFNAEIL